MTAKELQNYPYIVAAIKRYKCELAELWDDSAGSITSNISGMPHSPNFSSSKVERGYELNEKLISDTEKILNEYIERKNHIDSFFEKISDEQTRQIFELRFKKQMTWIQVAMNVGGANTSESVRKICDRYLKKNKYF